MCRDKKSKTGHRVVQCPPGNCKRSAPILRANLKADVRGLLVGIRHQKKRDRAAQHSNEHNRRQNLYRNRKPLLSLSFYFSFSPYPNAMTTSCHITVSTNNQSILLNHSRRGKSIPGYESDRKTRAGCSRPCQPGIHKDSCKTRSVSQFHQDHFLFDTLSFSPFLSCLSDH